VTPDDLKTFRAEHGLTQAVLSARLPVAKRTLEDWERGVSRPPEYLTRALRDLERELTTEPPPA
jgi:DNA-binding transcriptional regulator YiaG